MDATAPALHPQGDHERPRRLRGVEGRGHLLIRIAATAFSAVLASTSFAGDVDFERTDIIGTVPLPGVGQPLERVPSAVQTLDAEDVGARGALALPDLLERRAAGVHLSQAQNNPFQPDLTFRGFVASPLLGTPQGLSVFQDGVRVNEVLGDTVNWDPIPQDAIASLAKGGSALANGS